MVQVDRTHWDEVAQRLLALMLADLQRHGPTPGVQGLRQRHLAEAPAESIEWWSERWAERRVDELWRERVARNRQRALLKRETKGLRARRAS